MKIAVLGTGMVGRALAGRLAELGHEVSVGTRDVVATMERTEPDGMGNPPYAAWAAEHTSVTLAPFGGASAGAEMIVNATSARASIDVLSASGADNLAGKLLMDVSNPLDFSQGFPPTLFVKDSDSLAEQIQAAFPELKVVKALNTMNAAVMVNPEAVGGGDHSVFVSGNDAQAKAAVTALLESIGHTDVIDLGDISTARGAEMYVAFWVRLRGALNTNAFNIKVVR
ncbi:MAG: NAD(P)-binding domain-containing protein [Candidatus Dormibacter sp.]